MPFDQLEPEEKDFVQTHEDSKRRLIQGYQPIPNFYHGIDMSVSPDPDAPIANASYNQPVHSQAPYGHVHLPPVDTAYRLPDWWKDSITNDGLMLVLVLTLEGYETHIISRRLKAETQPGLNVLLSERKTINDMQRYISTLFSSRVLPMALLDSTAEGLIQGFVKWCTGEGLVKLARAKEFQQFGGDREQLRNYVRIRKDKGLDICQQYGYTSAWLEQRVKDNVWRNLLDEWWEHGTINRKFVPERKS